MTKPKAAETWLLLRASGTEPLLRIYTESCSKESVAKLLESARGLCAGRVKSLFTAALTGTSARRRQKAAAASICNSPMRGWSALTSTFHSARIGTEGTSIASEERSGESMRRPDRGLRAMLHCPSTRRAANRLAEGCAPVLLPAARRDTDQIVGRLAGFQMDKEFDGGQRQRGGRIDHRHAARVPTAAEAPRSFAGECLGRIRRPAKPPDAHQL